MNSMDSLVALSAITSSSTEAWSVAAMRGTDGLIGALITQTPGREEVSCPGTEAEKTRRCETAAPAIIESGEPCAEISMLRNI